MTQMGMEMVMTSYFKAPDKAKVVMSINGQDIVQLYDGTKGYMINPMTGSSEPQELPAAQADELKYNNSFRSGLTRYYKEGKLTLEGSENVTDKPAFKIKCIDGATTFIFFIDKSSWLPVKTTALVNGMSIEIFTVYSEINGLMVPKTTTTKAGGMEFVMTIDNVEVDVPLDDSIFKVK
ncbi:MAG: hypothetical protein C0408_07795 [Odoribacter sp.]|nr:hypothetical protein [Odoribacter sp.]